MITWTEHSWEEQMESGFSVHLAATGMAGVFGLKVYNVEGDPDCWDWHVYTLGESQEPLDDTYAWFGGCPEGDPYCKTEAEAKQACEKYLLSKVLLPAIEPLLPLEQWVEQGFPFVNKKG